MPTIFDNGIETPITTEEALQLLESDAIYPNTVGPWDYSVSPDLESDYEHSEGVFSILKKATSS